MKQELINKATRLYNKANIKVKKYSPELFLGLGIIGVVTSAVLACKNTLKINEIMNEKEQMIEKVHKGAEEYAAYSEKDAKKDLTVIYAKTGAKIFKLYALPISLGTLSILSIVQGHNILKKRNIAIAAAYTVVDKSFKDYRKNVVDRFGEKIDKELRYNLKCEEIEVETTDKKGKVKKEKQEVITVDGNDISEYARFFDEYSMEWERDSEYNLMFLRRQQEYANELLKSRGHVFLNEVYDMLGLKRSKAGQVVGWVYNKDNPNSDNYIDFNIYNIKNEASRLFVNGNERSILLDFNVDGVIYDLI